MNAYEWRETAAQLADASACGACRALMTFGDAIRAMPLPDMGGAEAMREACAMAVSRWAGKDWRALVRLIRALPLPAATPDKTAEALEKAREALHPFARMTFSFDGYSLDMAEIVFNGRSVATVKTSADHETLRVAVDRLREALAAIDARYAPMHEQTDSAGQPQ